MVITESQIRRIMPNAKNDRITEFVKSFNDWSDTFEINTKLRAAAFIGQIAHESSELNRMEENLNYSADALLRTWPSRFSVSNVYEYSRKPEKIANKVYANRMGNGNEQSGDGWRFRGRGLLMTTGKSNYKEYSESGFCNGDVVGHPEWLAKYPGALKSAMFYWLKSNLNRFADREDITGLTKAINGGSLGLAQRLYYWRQAKKVLGV